MSNKKQLTINALKYYVPLFQEGDEALLRLLNEEDIEDIERNVLETKVEVRNIALNRLTELAKPLIILEVSKIISGSILKNDDGLFDLIFYAGIGGMIRGLRKFKVEKIDKSATNYLFQWITTYAKKELLTVEAPFGIAPSRYYKYKKISAVRKKMEAELERQVTNEEVLAYFHGGLADVKTLNGPLLKARRSAANKAITLELVKEQEMFEKNMKKVADLDVDDHRTQELLSFNEENEENLLSLFLFSTSDLTPEAEAYLRSELDQATAEDKKILSKLSTAQYRGLGRAWAALVQDTSGPFYQFIKSLTKEIPEAQELVEAIESFSKGAKTSTNYSQLFRRKK